MSIKEAFIVAAKRTPFGTFGGTLKSWTATQLATEAAKAVVSTLPSADIIDSVCVGNVSQTSADTPYLARHVGLGAGVPIERPMLTVNRLCGSGFQSIITATQEIFLNESEVVLAGGSESMSSAPFAVRDCRWGTTLGRDMALKDTLWETLTDSYIGCPMAITAENLAEKYELSKEECDAFAERSQRLWGAAQDAGRFEQEIVPLQVKTRKGVATFSVDEHPRPATTLADLTRLAPLFKKDGTVSAGNASGISDGAGALVVASSDAVRDFDLTPLARIVSYSVCGVDPNIMGIGPVPAIRSALLKAGLTLDDVDLIEINEAFAPQALACAKDLGVDMDKLNTNGGAIAIGHPTGASGSRIMGHLAYELLRTEKRFGVGSACIGGGQGVAIVIERC